MNQWVEPRLRHIVADHLGVGPDELAPEVSLVDDLAADSLDLVELGLALEDEFEVTMPERVLDQVRTYGDLIDATVKLRQEAFRCRAEVRTVVRTRVVTPNGVGIERAAPLTPYMAEEIAEDVLRGGRGAALEVRVPTTTTDAAVAAVLGQFAWLVARGVKVEVSRDYQRQAGRIHPNAA